MQRNQVGIRGTGAREEREPSPSRPFSLNPEQEMVSLQDSGTNMFPCVFEPQCLKHIIF